MVRRAGLRRRARRVRAELRGARRGRRGVTRCTSTARRSSTSGAASPTSTTGAPYTEDTLQLVFSTTKGATAACANLLAQRGELDIDAPVAEVLARVRGRRARATSPCAGCCATRPGLPTVDAKLTVEEVFAWDPMIRRARGAGAATGSRAPRTATTRSPTASSSARSCAASAARASARSSHDEIAEPLGLEFWIGLPAEQEHRVAPLIAVGRADDDSARAARALTALHRARLAARHARCRSTGRFGELGDEFNSPSSTPPRSRPRTASPTRARWRGFYAALVGGVENGPSDAVAHRRPGRPRRHAPDRGRRPRCLVPGHRLPPPSGSGSGPRPRSRPTAASGASVTRGRRLGRASPTRNGHRGRLRDEQDDAGARRRPASARPDQGQLRRRRRPRRLRLERSDCSGHRDRFLVDDAGVDGVDEGLRVRHGPALRPSSWPFGMPANT